MDAVKELEALLEKAKADAAATVTASGPTVAPGIIVPTIAVASTTPISPVAPAPAPAVVAPVTPKPFARLKRPNPATKKINIAGQTYAADGLTQNWNDLHGKK